MASLYLFPISWKNISSSFNIIFQIVLEAGVIKEAIAFKGDSMGHLQYILPKMQWLFKQILDIKLFQ